MIDRYNHWDPHNKRATYTLMTLIIVVLIISVLPTVVWISLRSGYSPYMFLWFIPLIIPAMVIHELVHAAFQWLFSKKRPQLGFKFPYPYSKLRPNSSISRNQGAFSALSPFLLITSVLIVVALFMNPILQVAVLTTFYLHTPTCSGDFHFTSWLLKHPKNTKLRVLGFDAVLFRAKNV